LRHSTKRRSLPPPMNLSRRARKQLPSCFCFHFSIICPSAAPARLSRGVIPPEFVFFSSEVVPPSSEYGAPVVTPFDAYVKPVVDRYLANLDAGLLAAAVRAPLQIMQSRGGICSSATARLRSVRLFLSGPAAGVIGARMVGGAAGLHDLITVDIGGTSCDIALIEDGAPALRSEGRIGGYPVRVGL